MFLGYSLPIPDKTSCQSQAQREFHLSKDFESWHEVLVHLCFCRFLVQEAIRILLPDLLYNKWIIIISSVLKVFRSHCHIPWLLKNYPQQDFFPFFSLSILNDPINGASPTDRLFKSHFRTIFSPSGSQLLRSLN